MVRSYTISDNKIFIRIPYTEKNNAKAIKGWWWNREKKAWSYPATAEVIEQLNDVFGFSIMKIKNEDNGVSDAQVDVVSDAQEQARTMQTIADKLNGNEDTSILGDQLKEAIPLFSYDSPIKPFEHQRYAVTQMLKHKLFALFMEMGTGKTKAVIDLYRILKDKDIIDALLVICPKPVIQSWVEDSEKHSLETSTLSGTKQQRLRAIDPNGINIINYAGVPVLGEHIGRFNSKRVMVALDESSKIKNPSAKRTKLIVKSFVDNMFKLILSGTPITQNPVDIFSQFQFLSEDFFMMTSWYSFRNRYCITEMGHNGKYKKITGYQNLSELRSIIQAHSYILKKCDSALDLPEKIYIKRTLEMSKPMKEQYRDMKNHLVLEVDGMPNITAQIILTKMLRLQQILAGSWSTLTDNVKLQELLYVMDEYSGDQKVVIWCRFIESIKVIEGVLKEKDIGYVTFCGETKDRENVINDFRNKPELKVFIGQIQTGGMGLNLQCASFVVYYENTFSLQDRLQSEDRCHRPGQKNNVTYVDLVYEKTIDEDVLSAIKDKKKIADYLIPDFKTKMKLEKHGEFIRWS